MPNYVTHCYDNLRTGWNPSETVLTPDSVRLRYRGPTHLGQMFAYQVQGQVYAQPLYVENVPVAGSPKDLVFVATEKNWIYAFAADSPTEVWSRELLPAGEQLVTPSDIEGCGNVQPFIGITSTPVIDVGTQTMYVCAKSRSSTGSPPTFYHRLYAVHTDTGQDRQPPVVISASVQYPQEQVSFNAQWQLQRPALLLLNGVLYIGFGAHCDFHAGLYHGWVIAYQALTLQQIGAFPSTVSGMGGIWQAGRGLAGDAEGWVYCQTGNAQAFGLDYGNMVLNPAISTLWYVLGTKPPLPPPPDRSRDALFGGPAYYPPSAQPPRIYYSGQDEPVKAFYYDQAQGRLVGPYDQARESIPGGSIPVVSSNGGQNGILWAASRGNPRILYAYDLSPNVALPSALLAQQTVGTWSGSLAAPATVVNGRVYVDCDDQVVVFGLVPARWMSADAQLTRKSGTQRTIQVTVTDATSSAPIAGATVEIFNNMTGGRKAVGVTGANGQVSLTYSWCFEILDVRPPRRVEDSCPARASKSGYMDENFDTPI